MKWVLEVMGIEFNSSVQTIRFICCYFLVQKRVSSERCAELTIIAATHGLKEVWISYQVYALVLWYRNSPL